MQTPGQLDGVVKDLVNLELASVVQAAAQHGCLLVRQAMIDSGRSLLVTGIHKKHAAAGCEAGTNHLPKSCEAFRRNMGKPKAKKYSIELLARLPLEQVGFDIPNK